MEFRAKNFWITLLMTGLSAVCKAQQYLCVSECDPSGVILGQSSSGSGCCGFAGGFEVLGSAAPCQSCADFQSLPVSLSTSANPSPPMLGQPLTTDCTVTTPAALGATTNITWFRPDGSEAISGTFTDPSATLSLPITPFMTSDLGEYTCTAEVTSPSTPGVTTLVEGPLTITGPTQPLRITESSPPVAGDPYTLTCTETGTPGSLDWTGPDGMPITSGGGVTVTPAMTSGGVTTSIVSFTSVSLDDSGPYRCTSGGTSTTTTRTVTVDIPEPEFEIPDSTPPPTLGEPYTQTCDVSTPPSLQGNLTVTWFGPDGNQLGSAVGIDDVSALLSIPDFQSDDFGEYRCEVVIQSPELPRPLMSTSPFNLDSNPDCTTDPSICSPDADCVEGTENVFECVCRTGFDGDGETCTDIDECTDGTDNCNSRSRRVCTNTPGSFECTCMDGYTAVMRGNREICQDIDECAEGTSNCNSRRAVCTNTPGSFECTCLDGYRAVMRRNREICTDVDECAEGTDNCNPDRAVCTNTRGGYECTCKDGYISLSRVNGNLCLDINECRANTDNCSRNAICRNTRGGFTCRCRRGFEGDGYSCCRQGSSTSSSSDSTSSTTTSMSATTRSSREKRSHSSSSSTRDSTSTSTTESDSVHNGCLVEGESSSSSSSSSSTTRSTSESQSTT